MKEKLIIIVLTFSLSVNIAALLTFGYFWLVNYRGSGKGFSRGEPRLLERLNLDQRQRGMMRELRKTLLVEIAPLQEEMRGKRSQLIELLSRNTPDRPTLNRILEEISELQLKVEQTVVDHLLKEKRFLNPAQQARYFDLIYEQFRPYSYHERSYERGRRRGMREGRWREPGR